MLVALDAKTGEERWRVEVLLATHVQVVTGNVWLRRPTPAAEGCHCGSAPALLLEPRTSRRVHRVFVEADEPMRRARMVADYRRRTGASRAHAEAVYTSRESDETPIVLRSRQTASRVLRLDFAPGASGDGHDH